MKTDISLNNLSINQRLCPKCNSIITHVNKQQCNNAKRVKQQCKQCYNTTASINNNSYKIDRLLDDDLESFYWMGFLIADGWFSVNKQRIALEVCEKDYDHLLKFCKFINYKNNIAVRNHIVTTGISKSYKIKVCNNIIVPKIIDKFAIQPIKTYNPVNIDTYKKFTDNQILSIIAGIIDGDGSIIIHKTRLDRKMLQIAIHINWVDFLEFIKPYISPSATIILNKKMSILRLGVYSELKKLKEKICNLNIPILDRKWDRIDMNRINSHEHSKYINEQCIILYIDGKTPIEISKILNYNLSHIYKKIKKYNENKK